MKNSVTTSQEAHKNRALDPNVQQNHAATPTNNVWVGASAGTGKTKVLTDRVLRLLLPQNNGTQGTAANKILCLTFTKAGANEMALRINKTLGQWAILDEATLTKTLTKLLHHTPTPNILVAARKLFAQVVDTPGGIQIMTIHAFCQSVLARFPLEAGLTPNFHILDDAQASQLLHQAREHALKSDEQPAKDALHHIARHINENDFFTLIQDIMKERAQLQRLLTTQFGLDGLHTKLCQDLNIQPASTIETALEQACDDTNFNAEALRDICRATEGSNSKTDQNLHNGLANFLSSSLQERVHLFSTYSALFLTQKNEIRKTLVTKSILKDHPNTLDILTTEAERIQELQDRLNRIKLAINTKHVLCIGEKIVSEYNRLKRNQSALDFDDIIIHTYKLLENPDAAKWVLFKLDQGLDHILVDEAQDTNPEQWNIINALSDEFFSHDQNQSEKKRTIFVVGDEKQSIYSFQRASPEEFERTRQSLKNKIIQSQGVWKDIPLNTSFRTTKSILQTVDRVFSTPEMRQGLGEHEIQHHAYRSGQAGRVELWPLFKELETEEDTKENDKYAWPLPINIIEQTSPAAQLADHIAEKIEQWITQKTILPSRNRPVKAGDIMILMRSRSKLTTLITRALKNRNIPVSGADRMVLGQQIAVQDLLAFAAFGLLPEDDLTLACILKSPLIGITEEQLFHLAYNRPGTLWDSLQNNTEYKNISIYLKRCIAESRTLKPFEFFSTLIQTPCPADSTSGLRAIQTRLGQDALDPLDELLSLSLDFEKDNIPTLQYFNHWMEHTQTSIKREMESGTNEIRIMTVHGSKGLQAPIVILPDTIRASRHVPGQSDKRLLWPTQTVHSTPLWSPSKDQDPQLFTSAYNDIEKRLDEEYKRLFYVAMTRAEDQLYIGGHHGKKEPIEDSWYNYAYNAMKDWDQVLEEEDGTLHLQNAQEKEPDKTETAQAREKRTASPLPDWINRAAPSEHRNTKRLQPSKAEQEEPAAISPLESGESQRFSRGNMIHTLLQFLPDITPENRESALTDFLRKNAAALNDAQQKEIAQEILNILNHPDYAPFFGAGSQAEIPITGKLDDGRIISGQIDRLLVTQDTVWIVDFKTNRPPPKNKKDVPEAYIAQINAYRDTIKQIYPDHTVKTALLWTYAPHLMVFE